MDPKDIATNPLLVDLVLKKIMSFMTWKELSEVRLVNRHWNTQAIAYFRIRQPSIVFENQMKIERFNQVMDQTLEFPFGDFDFDAFGRRESDLLVKYGKYILELAVWPKELTIDEVHQIFGACPDLEYFSLRTTPFLTSKEAIIPTEVEKYKMSKLKTIVFRGHSDLESQTYNQQMMNYFIQLIPNVKSIKFDCSKEVIPKALEAMKAFPPRNLQILDVQVGLCEDGIKILGDWTGTGIFLKTLRLGNVEIETEQGPQALTTFLATQPTLTDLWIYNIYFRMNEVEIKPGPFTFPTMPNLKHLVMNETLQENGKQLVEFSPIVFRTTFPVLENLETKEADFNGPLKNPQPAEKVTSLSVSLWKEQVWCYHQFWKLRSMFPNVRKLTLINARSPWPTDAIFTYMNHLTHLSIQNGSVKFLDSVITGLCCRHTIGFLEKGGGDLGEESIQSHLNERDRPSICSLADLQELKIHQTADNEDGTDPNRKKMTDASAYLGFLQMKPLEKLEICESAAETNAWLIYRHTIKMSESLKEKNTLKPTSQLIPCLANAQPAITKTNPRQE